MNDYTVRTPQQLGPIMQGFRKMRELTQEQVGRKVGLPQDAISRLELDPSNAAFGRVFKILTALGMELVVRPRDQNPQPSEW